MREERDARWAALVHAAERGDAVTLVEEAGWVIGEAALGTLEQRSKKERATVLRALERARVSSDESSGPDEASGSDEAAEARAWSEAALRCARALLSGGDSNVVPAALRAPTSRRLTRWLAGVLPGPEVALCAGWVLRHPEEQVRVRAVVAAEPPRDEVIALAAEGAMPMRDPGEGTSLGEREGVEVVYFARPARRLAVYAAATESLRVEGEGLTTEGVAPGYWIGVLGRSARGALELHVKVGERSLEWTVRLPRS